MVAGLIYFDDEKRSDIEIKDRRELESIDGEFCGYLGHQIPDAAPHDPTFLTYSASCLLRQALKEQDLFQNFSIETIAKTARIRDIRKEEVR